MKRLYVGGLGQAVSEKDLRDRFGKFGEVSDVEIITRKDEDGSPLKIFAYININISDPDFKKCMTVLNKSRWKGGTLQIELAKESFLHRLAEERQKAAEKVYSQNTEPQEKIVESFKAAGVENFHMKAAVPGTEIPGHKDWVVSKFGRVLPVLHLKCEGRNKVFKYDPSKHCHNIKRLDAEDNVTPVSKLTWEIDGGYDEISKKRRGEFPPQKKGFKKTRKDLNLSQVEVRAFANLTDNGKSTPVQAGGDDLPVKRRSSQNLPTRNPLIFDSDADSEDEIRKLVAQECSRNQEAASAAKEEEEEDNLEVVGEDFVVKSNPFWGGGNGVRAQLASKSAKDDEEYDSADTDEILIQKKAPRQEVSKQEGEMSSRGNKKVLKKAPKKNTSPENSESSEGSSSESADSNYEAMMGNCYRLDLSLADLENLVKNAEEATDDEESDDVEKEPQDSPSKPPKSSSSSLAVPSKRTGNNPEDILAYLFEPDVEKEENKKKVVKSSLPAFIGTQDLFGSIAETSGLKRSVEEVDGEYREGPKRIKGDPKKSALEDGGRNQLSEVSVEPLLKKEGRVQMAKPGSSSESSSSDEEENSEETEVEDETPRTVKGDNGTLADCQSETASSSADSSTKDGDAEGSIKALNVSDDKSATPASKADSSSESTSADGSETSDEEVAVLKGSANVGSKQAKENAAPGPPQKLISDPAKQQQDNQKRLAAQEQRRQEAEQQKKLIQGALSKLDIPNANKGKHIVFDSDDDVDDGGEPAAPQKTSLFEEESESDGSEAVEKQSLKGKERLKAGSGKLFESSEDEDDEDDHFQIKPQFEGKAGQKLLELQSRFGTDPRFQMDAKFLESDGEAEEQEEMSQEPGETELVEEKRKNLSILQSVLNVSIQPSDVNKGPTKGKTFRDISALHYDPTSEAHAAFETKKEPPKKESKAARRKKREEEQKLPEVSKEIFYDVAVDLKEVFGTTKESNNEKKEERSWDKEEDEDEDEAAVEDTHLFFTSTVETGKDESPGFTFSFFGEDSTAGSNTKTDEYEVETLKGAKVSWQVDPRFQDSSSDDDDVGDEEENEEQPASATIATEEPPPTKAFFFFFEGDIRLKEGPRKFCRTEKLEDQRDAWEEKRTQLREDCRKKHKDARRRHGDRERLKPMQIS